MTITWESPVNEIVWESQTAPGITWTTVVGGTSSGGGVTVHNDLSGRSAADAHPMSAITDLEPALTDIATAVQAQQGDIGTLQTAVAGKQAADADLTAIAALAPADDALIQRKAGAWTSRTPAQVKADMSIGVGDVSGLDENTRDVIGAALVAGSGVAITVNDGANTITVAMADAATVLAALGVGWRKVDLQTAASAASSLSANLGVAGALKYRIHWRARSTANAVSATAGLRINSSSASDYTTAGAALTTSGYFGLMAGSQTNSDRWGAGVLEITPGPVAANAWSLLQGLESRVNSTATVTSTNSPIHGAWRDSVGAGMSTIQMIPSAGNLDVGSFMYVEVLL